MSKNTGKPGLTPKPRKRAKRQVENDAYGAMVRRMVRAYGRRVGNGDVEALTGLTDLVSEVDTAVRVAVVGLYDFGYSWADIAARL
ncbi:hypothetical protein, partial [Virgisporangium aliadipatigenens]|uniref:hypothetical protein n=1 Tax=Virgisporangium aliadipatigenens TaxID=741659 RepID=UPI001943FAB0